MARGIRLPLGIGGGGVLAFGGALGGGLINRTSPTGNPIQAETTALLAAMTVQPNAARQTLINDLIYGLKNAGLWIKIDFFYVLAAHDSQAARIGWKTAAN